MRPVREQRHVSQLGCSACGGALLVTLLLSATARSAEGSGWEAGAVVSGSDSGSESISVMFTGGAQQKKFPTLRSRKTKSGRVYATPRKGIRLTIEQLLVFVSSGR